MPVHTFSAANANSGDHAWTYSDDEEDDDDVCRADVGIAPHTDFEAFTLMHQDAPGLQLLSRTELEKGRMGSGSTRRSSTRSLSLWATSSRVHEWRVARDAAPRRAAVVLATIDHTFNAVAPDAVVAPLPKFGTPKYSPSPWAEHGGEASAT